MSVETRLKLGVVILAAGHGVVGRDWRRWTNNFVDRNREHIAFVDRALIHQGEGSIHKVDGEGVVC